MHDQDAVAHAQNLLQLRADQEHGLALRRHAADPLVDLVPGPDIDSPGRFVAEHDPRAAFEPLGDHDLLLIAARQGGHPLAGSSEPDVELLPPSGEGAPLATAIDHASKATEAIQVGKREVGPRALCQHQAVASAILRQQADTAGDRLARRPRVEPPAVEPDLAAVARCGAEDQARDLAAAGAHQPREPQDLAAADAEGHVADTVSCR